MQDNEFKSINSHNKSTKDLNAYSLAGLLALCVVALVTLINMLKMNYFSYIESGIAILKIFVMMAFYLKIIRVVFCMAMTVLVLLV